jgi:hypothetical protein
VAHSASLGSGLPGERVVNFPLIIVVVGAGVGVGGDVGVGVGVDVDVGVGAGVGVGDDVGVGAGVGVDVGVGTVCGCAVTVIVNCRPGVLETVLGCGVFLEDVRVVSVFVARDVLQPLRRAISVSKTRIRPLVCLFIIAHILIK